MSRERWRPLLILALLVALPFALAGLGYLALRAFRDDSAFVAEAWRILVTFPLNLYKVLVISTLALLLAAGALTPLAWWETRSARAFARAEEELRRERPLDVVTPYAGAEGDGVAFDGLDGRVLLLRPEAGVGAPRVVRFPAPPASADAGAPETGPDLGPARA